MQAPNTEQMQLFLEESKQQLARLKEIIGTLQSAPNIQVLDELYLIYHSMKGNSRMIDQNSLQELFHALGMLILDLKDYGLSFSDGILRLLRETPALIDTLLETFVRGKLDSVDINQFREKVLKHSIPPGKKDISKEIKHQANYFQQLGIDNTAALNIDFNNAHARFYEIKIVLEKNVFLKKTRVFTIIRNLALMDKELRFGKMDPPLEDLLHEWFGLEFSLIVQSPSPPDRLDEIIHFSMEISQVEIKSLSTKEALKLLVNYSNSN